MEQSDNNSQISKDSSLEEDIKTRTRLHRILNKLFTLYSESDEFKIKFKNAGFTDRALLLTVTKESLQGVDSHEIAYSSYNNNEVVRFGARYHDNKLEQYMPEDLSKFTVQAFLSWDTFIDLLVGKDRHGRAFNMNDAWGRKWIVFDGKDAFIHKEILSDMFTEFRYILKLETVLNL